ncbi:glycosyltransferase EpsF [Colwellia chukchiensis]|uniref:Glycosyltransferase EpsF n=1 Tax=Colwellia chukchiensis TaxID=641665 RepID=A0A1H7PUW5_9GAMM|nr:glycosyltransferase [Colwellia chukchiensis]SEL39278.1 glycosyltransferase EpsF [Colwellia chukchiensis]
MMSKLSSPKRVLHVFMNLNLGGAESRIMDMFRCQDKNVLENDFLIMTEEPCYFSEEVLEKGGKIHIITSPRQSLVKNLWQLYQVLRQQPKYNALHAHTSYYSGLCVFIAFLARVPVRIAHARNTNTGANNRASRLMLALGRQLIAQFATRRFAISEAAGRFLYGRPSGTKLTTNANFEVIANAFDFENIRPKSASTRLDKQRYQLDPDVINIVCVGRFYPVKNHHFLLAIAKRLQQLEGNFCLHLIGDGELGDVLRQQVHDLALDAQVRFWGNRNDIKRLLSLFDVMVMTSLHEGLGVAALEAQAAGLPCVLSQSMPKEADIGVGLCQFLSLQAGTSAWCDAILQQASLPEVDKKYIDRQFRQQGYCLSSTRQRYLAAYLPDE